LINREIPLEQRSRLWEQNNRRFKNYQIEIPLASYSREFDNQIDASPKTNSKKLWDLQPCQSSVFLRLIQADVDFFPETEIADCFYVDLATH